VYSRKDGIWKTYYESGQLKSESIIKDGVEEIKFYDRDGKLQPQNMDGC
jgi:antitoxin component YwqK of YwqJK toxin-antitoxin module